MEESALMKHTDLHISTEWQTKKNPFDPQANGFWAARVYHTYPAIVKFICHYNTLYFPFETQNCSILYNSWSYNTEYVDLWNKSNTMRLATFAENEEWQLISADVRRNIERGDGFNYTIIYGDIVVKRKARYYLINLIFPTIAITEIGILGFFTSSSSGTERGEKINLGMTTLLAMAVMLTLIADLMPPTSNYIPVISAFYIVIILLVATATFITCVIMEIERRGRKGKPLSKRVKNILIGRLPAFLCLQPPTEFEPPKERVKTTKGQKQDVKVVSRHTSGKNGSPEEQSTQLIMAPQIACIHKILTRMHNRFEEDEAMELIVLEWAFLAEVLDRIMLIFFNFLILLVTSIVLCLAYNNG